MNARRSRGRAGGRVTGFGARAVEARGAYALAAGLLLMAALACVTPPGGAGTPEWAAELTDTERESVAAVLPPEAIDELLPLSSLFYERITSRRFNSRATFEDPSVRQFFPTLAAYSDYYAALVDDLDRANIEFNRPTRIDLLGVEVGPGGNLFLSLRFTGDNDLPLRWWNATLERADEWTWREGRWYVVPGKV